MSSLLGYKVEACVTSYEQAINAAANGADRLEVCSRLETEGMTPDFDLIQQILDEVNIPVRIMIRETEVGFESDGAILEKMKLAIDLFKTIPIDGFVIGLLKNKRIDRIAMGQLIERCSPFPITIHKALDLSENWEDDIQWLNQFTNIDTILTSGGRATAKEGIEEILKMKASFKGKIMGAGKITYDQLAALHERLGLEWYHGRKIV